MATATIAVPDDPFAQDGAVPMTPGNPVPTTIRATIVAPESAADNALPFAFASAG